MKLVKTRFDAEGRVEVKLDISDAELYALTKNIKNFQVFNGRFNEVQRILGNNVDGPGRIAEQLYALAALVEMIEQPDARQRPLPQRGYLP